MDTSDDAVDALEEAVFQCDIISSFADRGWGLYPVGGLALQHNFLCLRPFVEAGREKAALEHHVKYLLLPLAEHDRDWKTIQDLITKSLSAGRGPFFVDIMEGGSNGDRWVDPIAAYLVDSVILEPPNLLLVVDKRLSRIRKRYWNYSMKGDAIELPLWEMWRIRKQLQLCMR